MHLSYLYPRGWASPKQSQNIRAFILGCFLCFYHEDFVDIWDVLLLPDLLKDWDTCENSQKGASRFQEGRRSTHPACLAVSCSLSHVVFQILAFTQYCGLIAARQITATTAIFIKILNFGSLADSWSKSQQGREASQTLDRPTSHIHSGTQSMLAKRLSSEVFAWSTDRLC